MINAIISDYDDRDVVLNALKFRPKIEKIHFQYAISKNDIELVTIFGNQEAILIQFQIGKIVYHLECTMQY